METFEPPYIRENKFKLIADFMNVKEVHFETDDKPWPKQYWRVVCGETGFAGRRFDTPEIPMKHYIQVDAQYDNSWDWLMPVYKKIKNTMRAIKRPSYDYSYRGDNYLVAIHSSIQLVSLKDAFENVIAFINWWNEHIKSQNLKP